MGRRLPWKRRCDEPNDTPDNGTLPKPQMPVRSTPTKSDETSTKVRKPRASIFSSRDRSPSTSPPPEPPPESFMVPGPLHDDKYRMVEDEFLSTAQLFTAHLHRAEYNRLKNAAKSQNAAAIRDIERPVVGTPTKVARQRRDAHDRAKKQREHLGPDADSIMTNMSTGLQGLMDSPSKENRFIRPFPLAKSTTRAAAGFGSNRASPAVKDPDRRVSVPEKRRASALDQDQETTDDNDDLAAGADISMPATRPIAPKLMMKKPSVAVTSARKITAPKPTVNSIKQTTFVNVEDDDDDDDPFGIQKRRIRREKSREHLRKPAKPQSPETPDVIPAFF